MYSTQEIQFQVIQDIFLSGLAFNKSATDFRILVFNEKFKQLVTRHKTTGERVRNLKETYELVKSYIGISNVEKKLKGEVFTPFELIEEMLNTLPKEFWENTEQKILDPANGIGNFAVILVLRLMYGFKHTDGWETNGLSDKIIDEEERYKWIVEKMIHVCDIQPKNMFIYREIFDPEHKYLMNFYKGSFLTEEFNNKIKEWNIEKFNLIMGNPPYQHPTNKRWKLWCDFIKKGFNISEMLLFVNPISWINSDGKELKETRETIFNNNLIYLNPNVNKYFNIGESVGYFLCDNKIKYSKTIIENYKSIEWNGERLSLSNNDEIKNSIFVKIENVYPKIELKEINTNKDVFVIPDNSQKFYKLMHSASNVRYTTKEKIKNIDDFLGWGVLLNWSGHYFKDDDNKYMFVSYDIIPGRNARKCFTKNEMEAKNLYSLLSSKLYSFYVDNNKTSGFNSPIYNLPMLNISKSWTNEEIYNYFNLTEEEIKIIENI